MRSEVCWEDLTHVEAVQGSAIAVVAIFLLARFITTPKNIPPGPFAWPIIGSLHLIGPYPHRSLAKLAEKYGSLMSVWFGQRLIIVATSPETALEFVKTQDANFCSRPKQQAPSVLLPHGKVCRCWCGMVVLVECCFLSGWRQFQHHGLSF